MHVWTYKHTFCIICLQKQECMLMNNVTCSSMCTFDPEKIFFKKDQSDFPTPLQRFCSVWPCTFLSTLSSSYSIQCKPVVVGTILATWGKVWGKNLHMNDRITTQNTALKMVRTLETIKKPGFFVLFFKNHSPQMYFIETTICCQEHFIYS